MESAAPQSLSVYKQFTEGSWRFDGIYKSVYKLRWALYV